MDIMAVRNLEAKQAKRLIPSVVHISYPRVMLHHADSNGSENANSKGRLQGPSLQKDFPSNVEILHSKLRFRDGGSDSREGSDNQHHREPSPLQVEGSHGGFLIA